MSNEYKARIIAELDTSKVEQQIKDLGNKKIKFTAETGNSTKKVNEIDKSIKTAERSSRTFGDTLKRSFNIGAAASITAKGFQLIRTAANNAKEAVKDFDSSITKLRMATGGTYGETANLVTGYNAMGKQLGAITSEVSNGANAWLRQGHSFTDTNTLIRDSMILSKVATLESADSTEYLTSAMKGYGVAAKDVIGIVDKLTAVDLVSATDAGGLAEGMSRTAQSAKLAGVSMDKLLGYLAVTGEVTQKSMSSIGEGFKTIFTRMADIKAGKLQFIDEDGTAESLSDVETVLTALGIRLRESNNEFRNFGVVLDEVAANWSSYSSVQQAALSKAFAGTRQSENFKVLMENYDLAIEYMNVAADSAGTAEQKFGAYLDSIEAKSKSLQAAFEALSLNVISAELVGDILDVSTSIIELLDETNLINGALAGIGAAGAIKGFAKLTTIIMNAVVRLNEFNKAMRMVKVSDLGADGIAQLASATRNLSNSQLKAVLSSKALTVEQRLAILTAHGMTQAEAKAALSAMGLATAQGTAAAATVTLSGTLKGLWATLKANPLILIATAVTAAVSIIQTLNDKQEAARQKILETGEAAKEEAEALSTLYNEYKSAKAAYDANTGSKQQLDSATQSLLDSLGIEESQIDGLITKYGSLSAAIQQVSIEKLKASRDDLTAGLEAATEELLAKTEDGWLSGDFGTIKFSLANGAYGEDPFADVLEAAGYRISSEFSNFGGYQGSFIDVGEGDTLEESLALYQELLDMQAKLSEGVDSGAYTREELLESPVYKAINDKIAEFETEVESVQSFIDEINSTSAQIIHMEFSAANGIPETQVQFESYKQTLINTALSSGQFIGSQEAIEASIIDMLATLPEMSKFMTDYANELASEKPTFKSFSEIIFDDPEDDKDAIDTLNNYLDQVKQLDDALAKIGSGDFSASDFYELANSFPDLYHLVEETGSWEAAINAVRASIVGVKGESKDATTVFGLMSTMFQGMDFANEENFASWVQFWQTVEDSVSTGEKAALTFNSMSDAMKGIGDAASFAAQAQEELVTDGVNSLDTLQTLIGTFGAEAASSMYKVTTKGVIVDVEKVKEAYINAISEINGLSIQESAALDELWDMEFKETEFNAFVDSMGEIEKAAGFVADAQKEIGENGHNSFETLTELYDLLGEDANKYISYADGKPIIDFEGVKQEYFDMIDEMEQATPELKQIMKDTFEFELEESSFDTIVDNYIADAQTLQDALKKVQEDGLEPIDMYKLMDEFPELKGKSEDLEGAIIDLLGSMDADVIAAFNEQFGKCDSEEDRKELEDFMEVVLAVGKVVGETQFAIDISAEAEGMDNLFTAIKESVSSTGLAAESIENLKKRYASLSGVDVSSLFERTENGIHLNTKALRELESEYEKVTKTALDTKLNDLVDQYNKLTEQIDNAGIAASTVNLYAQRNDILQQINETADLASQYAGLTSAFYKWEQAQSMGEEGDMYDSLTGGLENVKQLYEDGLVGTNKFRTAVQLMSSEDLSNATAAELIDAYEAGYPKMQRYFQDSSDGVLNFLHDVQDLNSEWAHLNEDGSWDIDFGVGGDQEIADALGINVEAVQSILRKLSDYGFDINLDMQYSDLDTVQTKAEKAAETLKKLGATDYQFNFGATNIDRVEEQITEAEKALDKFRNEDGSINLDLEGAEEAQYILAALVLQKQSLESPTILSIDAGNIDGAVGETLRKLQKIKTSYNNMQLQAAIGADTSQIQSEINSTISSLTTEELEIAAQLGIDTTTSLETLNSQISEITPEMLLTVGVNQEAVTAFMESSHDTSANVTYNVRDHRVRAYKAPGKTGNVIYEADMIAWEPPTKYGKIVYTATYASPSKGETNRGQGVASGTAYAQGDWSTKRSGTALGGELGREIVVRNGKYFTIGDYGAEFFQYKKGDIIFNHKQTEQLLKNGKISGITPRGKALAEGTAFSGGNGTITGSGSVITKPSGSSSSGSGSSGSSSDDESDPSIKDWIEVAISRIQRLVEKAANAFASIFKPLPKRLEAATEQMRKMREELAIQEAGFERYMQEANSVGLSDELKKKVHDGTIDIKEYDEETAELIESYTEWYEKALDCKDAIDELHESLASLYQERFDTITTQMDNELALEEHRANTINNGIAQLDAQGYLGSIDFYKELQAVEQSKQSISEKRLADLIQAMSQGINSGEIEAGSEAWYSMQIQINDTKEAIQESQVAVAEYGAEIQNLEWSYFDYVQDRISKITDEASTLISLLENSDLYTERGQLTDEGTAAMGLHGQNYNTYLAQAEKYADEIEKIDKQIANDPYNTDLIERREELLSLQHESVSAAEEEKQAIIDMVEEGINLELESLRELIDAYEESLDSAKDLYDYQKKIKKQSSEVQKLQKQLSAYANDTSEENKARIQKLQVELAEAEDELAESQYDQYIKDQKKLLDDLYSDYETVLNQRLDDTDALISDMIDAINADSKTIEDTITTVSDKLGLKLSNTMTAIWSGDGGISGVITKYGTDFTTQLTSLNAVLNGISANVSSMVLRSNTTAGETITNTTTTTPTIPTEPESTEPVTPPVIPTTPEEPDEPETQPMKVEILDGRWNVRTGAGKGYEDIGTVKEGQTFEYGGETVGNWHSIIYKGEKAWVSKNGSKLIQGFSEGGYVGELKRIAQMQGDDVITVNTLKRGEAVLTPDQATNFSKLANNLHVMSRAMDTTVALEKLYSRMGEPAGGESIGSVTNHFEFNMPIDHVDDYNDLMYKMQHDGKFEKFIQSMTTDRMMGKSKLEKYKYHWT